MHRYALSAAALATLAASTATALPAHAAGEKYVSSAATTTQVAGVSEQHTLIDAVNDDYKATVRLEARTKTKVIVRVKLIDQSTQKVATKTQNVTLKAGVTTLKIDPTTFHVDRGSSATLGVAVVTNLKATPLYTYTPVLMNAADAPPSGPLRPAGIPQ